MKRIILLVSALTALTAGCALVDAPSIDAGELVSTNNPRLNWLETNGAAKYQVQLCRDYTFLRDVKTPPFTEETGIPLEGLVEFSRGYFWRVRAIDSDGFPGPWSKKGYFILLLSPPTPLSPIGEVSEKRPAITWEKSDYARRYVVEISEDGLFRLPEYRYETTARDYFPEAPATETGKKYYWRVRAITADGAMSNWSRPVAFTAASSAASVNLSPCGGHEVASLKPALTWSAEKNAIRYQVEIIRADEINSAEPASMRLQFTKGTETALTLKKSLAPATEYAWRVRPIMPEAPGKWSAYVIFRTSAE